jgi:hypothetical protein
MIITYEAGIALAERNYAQIKAAGKKWLERNAEKVLREQFFFSHFITIGGTQRYIHIIHPPSEGKQKIFFKKYELKE